MVRGKRNSTEVSIKKKKKKDKIDVSEFVFSWENVPGKDEKGLREYLKNDFFVDWAEKAKIEKKDNEIIASYNNHKITFKLDEEGHLFDLDWRYRKYIKEGQITEELRDGFYINKIYVPARANVRKVKEGEWEITVTRLDGLTDRYFIRDTGGDTNDAIKIYNEGRVFVQNEEGVQQILIVRKEKKNGEERKVYNPVIIIENVVASITIDLAGVQSKYISEGKLNIGKILEDNYMKIFENAIKEGKEKGDIIGKIKEVVNIAELGNEIDINKDEEKIINAFRKILKEGIENGTLERIIHKDKVTFLYNRSRFPGIVFRLKDMELAMLIFDSGSVICTGAGKEEFVYIARDRLVEKLKEFDINLKSEPKIEFQNIVASTMFYPKINLDEFADYDENTEYEPEQFPGLIYKLEDPNAVMLVFRSGRIVITGAKSVKSAIKAARMTKKAIMDAKALIPE